MSNLYLLCGKPGCGKSTLAKRLENDFKIVHFSADDYMLQLFGEVSNRAVFETNLRNCKEIIYQKVEKLLNLNVNVVLDFGFWQKKEREEIKERFKHKAKVLIIYLSLTDEEIFKRIDRRNRDLKKNEYYIDENTFKFLSNLFEEPDPSEDYVLYSNDYEQEIVKKLNLEKR